MKSNSSDISPYDRRPLSRDRCAYFQRSGKRRTRYTSSLVYKPVSMSVVTVNNDALSSGEVLEDYDFVSANNGSIADKELITKSKILADVVSLFPEQ